MTDALVDAPWPELPEFSTACLLASEAARHAAAELGIDVRAAMVRARDQGFVLTRGQALACGLDGAQVRRLLRRRIWTTPRRGVLAILAPTGTTAQAMAATAAHLAKPHSVVSHESAAVLHGLPTLWTPARPILTVRGPAQAGGRPDVRAHGARLRRSQLGRWFGVPVTSVARTVFDISRSSGRAAGLVTADAALHADLVTRAQLRSATVGALRWPGVRAAREIAALADGRAESPLESLSRLCLYDGGLPMPTPQLWIVTARGRYRADLGWEEYRLVIECDGRLKYEAKDAFWKEKLRQDAIDAAGYRVLRVTWEEVTRRPDQVVARVRAELARRRPPATSG